VRPALILCEENVKKIIGKTEKRFTMRFAPCGETGIACADQSREARCTTCHSAQHAWIGSVS